MHDFNEATIVLLRFERPASVGLGQEFLFTDSMEYCTHKCFLINLCAQSRFKLIEVFLRADTERERKRDERYHRQDILDAAIELNKRCASSVNAIGCRKPRLKAASVKIKNYLLGYMSMGLYCSGYVSIRAYFIP